MDEIDKETMDKHTRALNRVADALGDLLQGLPGFVKQLERNEALLHAQQDRVKTMSEIERELERYERKKKENQRNKTNTTPNAKPGGDQQGNEGIPLPGRQDHPDRDR